MPELPEVEVVRAGLAAALIGHTVDDVEIRGPLGERILRRYPPGPGSFRTLLRGRRIMDVRRRGKYLWWVLDGGDALLGHLGMSGQFRIRTAAPVAASAVADERHVRVRFRLDGPVVDFVDQRTFGALSFAPDGAQLPAEISHIARDLFDPQLDRGALAGRIRDSRRAIKSVLLDQRVVSGIGNIYADEALWAARVHYARPAAGLAPRTIIRLLDAAHEVMRAALAVGGTSFDELYVDVTGASGYFERELHAYGRADRPCRRCGGIIRRHVFTGRSSYFCPRCQRAGR